MSSLSGPVAAARAAERWRFAATTLACAGLIASAAAKDIGEDDVTAALKALIAARTQDGALAVRDARTGTTLALVFEDIRVVRGLQGFGWFPDAIFHDRAAPQKKYAVDFWLQPDAGKLKLMDVRIHKDPQPDGASWMMITRAPLAWWWLPTLERASAVAGVQAWQVMGAAHQHIVNSRTDGVFKLSDASGQTIELELVDVVQPVVRSKEDGGYFACAAFRKIGGEAGLYAVDFKFDQKTGSVSAGGIAQHENPLADNGKAAPLPRCRFAGAAFEVVD